MPADPRLDLRALLDAVEAAPPTAGVEALAGELANLVGAAEVSFLIVDIVSGSLARLARTSSDGTPPADGAAPQSMPIEGTAAGRALRSQQVQLVQATRRGDDGDHTGDHTGDPAAGRAAGYPDAWTDLQAGELAQGRVWLYAPVTERGEAVGVLELLLPAAPDSSTVAYLASAAHALAYVVIADRRFTDLYEFGARSAPLSLEAEIQRRLLPASYTCEGGQFTLAGWLVPANEAGGDTFDFALDRDTLQLSITDAMGHGVMAAQLATLVVASLRNSRRSRAGVLEQAGTANDVLHEHAGVDQLVTGLLLRLDLATGTAEVVNAGHVPPLLVRAGQVSELDLPADPAFGVLPGATYLLQRAQLEPGDRLVLLTDGMLERNAVQARIADLLSQIGDLHPREAVQALTSAVQQAAGGQLLDDATVDHGMGTCAKPRLSRHRGPSPTPRSSNRSTFVRRAGTALVRPSAGMGRQRLRAWRCPR